MAEPSGPPKERQNLSSRIEALRLEVQELVKHGAEHPLFEFKRELSIKRENLGDRLDFIKLLQGVANSEAREERCIVIGADPKNREFHGIENCAEFDQATVTSILEKYLHPAPRFQVFNNLRTTDGKAFVLFVLDGAQPQPIVLKTEGTHDGKTRLKVGEIWIKRGTALFPATRDDLEQMYRERIEEEAEDRARKRLKSLSEISPTSFSFPISKLKVPTPELFVGPGAEFRRFVEEIVAEQDIRRLSMLMELAREWVVDGWDQVGARTNSMTHPTIGADPAIEEFFRDKFIPALQSIVALGLLIVKYDQESAWLSKVVDVLLDAFEATRGLQALKNLATTEQSLIWWRPGLELYIGTKCIAAYAMHRNRYHYLPTVLRRAAKRIEFDDRDTEPTPFLFWPLSVYTEFFANGQASRGSANYFWQERISASWGSYFGSFERFISASCQLEFVLELNSYMATNAPNDEDVAQWLSTQPSPIWYGYQPDIFAYSLGQTIPIAETILEQLLDGSNSLDLFSVNNLMPDVLSKRNQSKRGLFLGGFLDHLRSWQSTYAMRRNHFPPYSEWSNRLKGLVQSHRSFVESQRDQTKPTSRS